MKIVDESVKLNEKNIEVILNYLPYFEDENQRFYDVIMPKRDGTNIVDYIYVTYSDKFMEFYKALHDQGFVTNFNWLDSSSHSEELSDYYDILEDADIKTLRRLFTMIVRQDKHKDGFFADVIESGLLLAMLNKLKILNDEM